MKQLGIAKVDRIFKEFQDTFNPFCISQEAIVHAVDEFKRAVKTKEEFSECLKEFKRQLNHEKVVMKKLVLKFPKAILKSADSVGSAATALVGILEAYHAIEKLPVKVTNKSISCAKDAMELDPTEIVNEEFSGSVFDLGTIPKQMTNFRENLKQIKKAPQIVRSFFQYSTSIVMQIIDVFGDDKSRGELEKREEKMNKEMEQKESEMQQLDKPEPPKEINFTSLGIPSIDRIFNDIAKIINPVAKLSKDLYDARGRLEDAMKAISEFRDDKTKAFNDYLDELKERTKKGDVRITVSVKGNRVEVDKVEGLEPSVMKNIQSGLRGVIKSGNEIEDLGPDTTKKLIKLLQDVSKISKSDIKSHVSLKEIASKVSALNENTRKAKKIPGVLKFFLSFIRNLLMDILEVLHAKRASDSPVQESESEGADSPTGRVGQPSSEDASAEDN